MSRKEEIAYYETNTTYCDVETSVECLEDLGHDDEEIKEYLLDEIEKVYEQLESAYDSIQEDDDSEDEEGEMTPLEEEIVSERLEDDETRDIEELIEQMDDEHSQVILFDSYPRGTGKTEEVVDQIRAIRNGDDSQSDIEKVRDKLGDNIKEIAECPCDNTDYDWFTGGFGFRYELMCSECLLQDIGAVGTKPFDTVVPISEAARNGGDSSNEGDSL